MIFLSDRPSRKRRKEKYFRSFWFCSHPEKTKKKRWKGTRGSGHTGTQKLFVYSKIENSTKSRKSPVEANERKTKQC